MNWPFNWSFHNTKWFVPVLSGEKNKAELLSPNTYVNTLISNHLVQADTGKVGLRIKQAWRRKKTRMALQYKAEPLMGNWDWHESKSDLKKIISWCSESCPPLSLNMCLKLSTFWCCISFPCCYLMSIVSRCTPLYVRIMYIFREASTRAA